MMVPMTTISSEGAKLRRDAADNHRRLLAAAVAEFNERGMDASVEQIAARAGVGIGTFYRRFGTKDALVDRLVNDLMDQLTESARALVAAGDGSGLEQFLRELTTALVDHRGSLPRLWSGTPKHTAELRTSVAQLLRIARAEGAIRPDIHSNDVSVLMWSLRSVIEIAGESAGVACQRHLDIALAGMRPGAETLQHPPLSERARQKALLTPAHS